MRTILLGAAALAIATAPAAMAEQTLEGAAPGVYKLENTHAFLTFAVGHNDLSDYVVNFTDFDATLNFYPDDLEASGIEVSINPTAVNTHYPDAEKKVEWETKMTTDEKLFNAGTHPAITFTSTAINPTGEFTGTVTGDLTFLGVTQPVTMDVTYNGVGNQPWWGERDLIGFNAVTTITRSDFGMTSYLPNISDEVEVRFTGEFLQVEE